MRPAALRFVVAELAGGDDAGWIIFEGQSVDWLILNGNAVLSQHAEDPEGISHRLGTFGKRLRDLFKEAEKLKSDRNVVIHGDWRSDCFLGNELDGCKPHSVDSLQADKVMHVVLSRYRKGHAEQAWSVAEIEALASKMAHLAQEIRGTYKKSYNEYLGRCRDDASDPAES